MATTSDIKIAEGSGKNIAAYSITEDSETKQLQRIVLANNAGTEILPAPAVEADSIANPTLSQIGTFLHLFSGGSVWNRMRDVNSLSDSGGNTGLLAAQKYAFNEFNHDRWRNNTQLDFLTSASRTTTQTQSDQTNYNGLGIKVILDVTVIGTGSITLEIDEKDTTSGKYIALLTGAAVITNSTNVYTIYPAMTAVANVTANNRLGRTFRIKITANNANAITYSCGFQVLL